MRLLETTTLTLEFFFGEIPEYAILSHRWEDEEVVYEDIRNGVTKEVEAMKGFPKVRGSCRLARQEGYKYIWIDTCCIDKSSSAELSESINSMFDWYRTAAVCYAYLSDAVDLVQFPNSLWFTRGWTLQELIAPSEVVFYNPYWMELGSRSELRETIEFVTGIPTAILLREVEKVGVCFSCNQGALGFVLTGPNVMPCNHNQDDQTLARALDSCSIAQRLSWASRRRTTRPEDTAYSLLGIFGVNMPLLYGEGTRAFLRLQEEIIKTSNDQSILAFTRSGPEWPFKGNDSLLAQSPHLFAELGNIVPTKWAANVLMTLTAKAIETTLLMCPLSRKRGTREDTHNSYHLGILHCEDSQKTPTLPALILEPVDEGNLVFRRVHGYKEIRISPEQEKILLGRGMISTFHQNSICVRWMCRYLSNQQCSVVISVRIASPPGQSGPSENKPAFILNSLGTPKAGDGPTPSSSPYNPQSRWGLWQISNRRERHVYISKGRDVCWASGNS